MVQSSGDLAGGQVLLHERGHVESGLHLRGDDHEEAAVPRGLGD